jgi:hypothetical protein
MEGWKRAVVFLVAFAFVLQGLGLFAQGARAFSPARLVATSSTLEAMAICLHRDAGGETPVHRDDSGGCPICQTLGCALAGAPMLDLDALCCERLLGILSIPALDIPERQRARYAAHPRGPPSLV